jgi:hypothetical protein
MSSRGNVRPSSIPVRTVRLKFSRLLGHADRFITEERLRLYPIAFIVGSVVGLTIFFRN